MKILHIPTLHEYAWEGVDFQDISENQYLFLYNNQFDGLNYAEIARHPIKSESYAPKYEFCVVDE